jgi:type IV pilus assembly protein PilB
MSDSSTIAGRVLEALVGAGVVTADQVASVRAGSADDSAAGVVMLQRGLVRPDQLANALEVEMGFPRVELASYAPDDEALELMPVSVARAHMILPLFEIEGTLTVAIGDPSDVFKLDSVGEGLGLSLDAVLADPEAVSMAVEQYFPELPRVVEPEHRSDVVADDLDVSAGDFFDLEDATPLVLEAPAGVGDPTPEPTAQTVEQVVDAEPAGVSMVDLDVLAVADHRKVAALVSDILEQAVGRGASRIHLLPYKTDFFLVFRIKGKLEKIASAPVSMQQPLIEGFKAFAKLGSVEASRPALGRMHAEIGGMSVVLTISSVPTLSGQRMVISLAPMKPQPKSLGELGMADAESRALYAMVERGRGILLVAAPVTGGRSTTYYALLNHAAQIGKTVYSVERSVEYEIPAVAQVLVSPGQPIGAAGYFSAGMRQDTDVMAIDSLQTVEEVHLAIEAAGMGKLVIATFAAGDVASAVRRMLDLGAESVSLASALTLGVGQRVVRVNCPNCSVEERDPLADRIPGAEPGGSSRRGTGCPNCGKSGFSGATGIFEVLPFTEPVRAVISRGGDLETIVASARAAGMRSLSASGLNKVREGHVSPAELDRVLRFSQ